jgi:hypothetical protein
MTQKLIKSQHVKTEFPKFQINRNSYIYLMIIIVILLTDIFVFAEGYGAPIILTVNADYYDYMYSFENYTIVNETIPLPHIRGEFCNMNTTQSLFDAGLTFAEVNTICQYPVYYQMKGLMMVISVIIFYATGLYYLIILVRYSIDTIILRLRNRRIDTAVGGILANVEPHLPPDKMAESKAFICVWASHKFLGEPPFTDIRLIFHIKAYHQSMRLIRTFQRSQLKPYVNPLPPVDLTIEAQGIICNRIDSKYLDLICNVIMFYRSVRADNSPTNWFFNIFNFIRLYYGFDEIENIMRTILFVDQVKPLRITDMPDVEAQSLPSTIAGMRSFVDTWKSLSGSELARKFENVTHGLISCGVLKHLGLTFSEEGYRSLFGRGVPKMSSLTVTNLAYQVTEFAVTMVETGYECFTDRNLQPLLIKDRKVRQWAQSYTNILEVINRLPHDASLSAADTIQDIRLILAQGAELLAYEKAVVPMWRDLTKKYETLQKEYGIPAIRKPPFAVLIHGNPGIGKSSVVTFIITIYAKLMKQLGYYPNIEYDPQTSVYTLNSSEEFMSGYKGASQWAIVMDDMAKEHPSHVAKGLTNHCNDVIEIINSIGTVSKQAHLEDKGKIPICPKLVVATTNIKDLSAHHAMAEPSAVLRRFQLRIGPSVKAQYFDHKTGIMKKLTTVVHDGWDYIVEQPRLFVDNGVARVVYDVYCPDSKTFVPPELITENTRCQCTAAEMSQIVSQKMIAHEENATVMFESTKDLVDSHMCEHNVLSIFDCPECVNNDNVTVNSVDEEEVEAQSLASFTGFSWLQRKLIQHFDTPVNRVRLQNSCVGLYRILPNPLQNKLITHLFVHHPELLAGLAILNSRYRIPPVISEAQVAIKLIAGAAGIYAIYSAIGAMFPLAQKVEARDDGWCTGKVEAQNDIWSTDEVDQDFFRVPQCANPNNDINIVNTVRRSMIRISVDADGRRSSACAIGLGPSTYVTVQHVFPPSGKYRCIVDYGESHANVSSTQTFTMTESNISRLPNDLVIFKTTNIRPRRHLYKFLPEERDSVGRICKIVTMLPGGTFEIGEVITNGIRKLSYDSRYETISGEFLDGVRDDRKPMLGDCGSVIISRSSKGFFISGMQCAGAKAQDPSHRIICTQLSQDSLPATDITSPMALAGEAAVVTYGVNQFTGPLLQPHYKGIHCWVKPGSQAIILGSFAKRSSSSSHTRESIICKEFCELFGYDNPLCPPLMAPICENGEWRNPYTIAANDVGQITPHYDDATVFRAVSAYVRDTTSSLEWLDESGSVSVCVAINGVHGDSYLKSLPMSTSGGFGFPGVKRQYFHYTGEFYEPDDMLSLDIARIEEAYAMDERAHVVFQGALKDEPVKHKKYVSGATRVFTASSVAFSIVVRKHFLLLTKCVRKNNFLTECAVGMNCYSQQWDDLYHYLVAHGVDNIGAGDHKAFDKNMPPCIIRGAFQILINYRIMKGNLTALQHRIMVGIATDISYPIVNMNGDLFQFFGSNPSGQPLTLLINSLANSLYMRIAYHDIVGDYESFKMNVNLMTMGDDNIFGSGKPEFNHTSVAEAMRLRGLTYTMADKDRESVPFINIKEADFLKRTFRRNEVRYVAPINPDSIYKSLCMIVEKQTISEEQVIAQSYLAARMEASLHGRTFFTDFTRKMDMIFTNHPNITRFFIQKHHLSYEFTLEWTLGESTEEDSSEGSLAHTVQVTPHRSSVQPHSE